MDNNLFRLEDLVNNPTARVPVCLCLDVSDTMNLVIEDDVQTTGETVMVEGQECGVTTEGTPRHAEMVKGIEKFFDAVRADEIAVEAAEICIVTFGQKGARLVQDFASIEQSKLPKLVVGGETPMGEGVNLALDRLEARKEDYKRVGVDYYQPWLVLMTDGEANGDPSELSRAQSRATELVNGRRLTVFPIGIGNEAGMETLRRFSPRRPPLHLKNMNFQGFFEWLGKSVAQVSNSMPGESIKLDTDAISSWGEL